MNYGFWSSNIIDRKCRLFVCPFVSSSVSLAVNLSEGNFEQV